MTRFDTTVNGTAHVAEVDGHESAVEVIRDQFGLTGTKLVCGGGVCGACTILIGGEPTASCLLPATSLRGTEVTTVEGLGGSGDSGAPSAARLHPMQRAFLAEDALQCGYCTPGFVMGAAAFHDRWRQEHGTAEPDRHTIAEALAGHLCRCGAYEGIYRAVAAACRGDHDHDGDEPDRVAARVDGPDKVTGRAIYTTDVTLPDMLHGALRRSAIAAALVGRIDRSTAAVAVDLLGDDRRVRWAGQPIAAVAAETPSEARRVAAELDIEITPLPFVIDPEEAKKAGAPLVHEDRRARRNAPSAAEGPVLPATWDGNRRNSGTVPFRGMAAKRRVRRARETGTGTLVELELSTAPQLHSCFEPHACVADWSDPARLRLWVSTQAVDHTAHSVAEHFGIDEADVEVVADNVGGGFGSKVSLGTEIIAATELSRLSRRPVKLVLDRHEELTGTGNRPGSRMAISMLADDDGRELQALLVDVESHAGVGIGNVVGALAMLVYERSPRLAHDYDILTNGPPGSPFRGPGGPITAWALEQAIDEMAHRLGQDPIALRQRWDGNERRGALYRWAAELPVWRARPVAGAQTGRFRRGVGVAAANWFYFVDPDSEVVVSVEDGRLVASTASQDMGTGSRTVVARAVAEVFDVQPTEVEVRLGRSNATTIHGPTSAGSRTTVSLWSATTDAATELRREIGGSVSAAANGTSATARRGGDRGIRAVPITVAGIQIGRGFSGAVHVSEVEVDTRTGRTRVLRVHGGIAVGRIHAPELARSQCEGSIIQGIGLALYENQVLDPHTGLTLTANLEDYRIPQLGDTPEIEIHFEEAGWDHVPGGGVGLGEVATISPAASIGNAIHNATGWRATALPVRPDRMIEALSERPSVPSAPSRGAGR